MAAESWQEITGSIYGNPELSKKARLIARKSTRLMEAVDPPEEFALGKKSGDTVGFRLVGRLTDDSTTALGEFQKLPLTKPPIYHATGSVNRYGLAIAWTGSRADLDRLDVEDMNINVLKDQLALTINKLISTTLVAGRSYTYVAQTASTFTWATDGTVAQTAAIAFSRFHATKVVLKATQVNMPPADGQNYFFFCSPEIEADLLNDVSGNGYVDVAKYASGGAEGVLNGEVGRVGRLRLIVDNDSNSVAQGIGSGSAFGSGFILGAEAIRSIMVYPPEFRVNTNLGNDFGNQSGIAWQTLEGWKVPWNYTTHGQGSVIHYTSA